MIVRRLAQPILLIASMLVAMPCEAATLLDRLSGAWRGKGTIHNVDSAEIERIACRLGTRTPEKAGRTNVEGRCSTANATANFSIEIEQGNTGRFTAVIATSVAPEQTRYLGRERGQNLAFSSRSPVAIKSQYYNSSIVIRFHGNDRFGMSHIVSHTTSGENRTLFSAEFTRSKKGGEK